MPSVSQYTDELRWFFFTQFTYWLLSNSVVLVPKRCKDGMWERAIHMNDTIRGHQMR